MSTPTTIDTTRPAVPFGRLVRVEFRKMTDTRAGRTLVAVTAALMLLAAAIMVLVAGTNDKFDATASDFASVQQFVSLLILPVFAAPRRPRC
jgi:ABC-2 type transport system permease protein